MSDAKEDKIRSSHADEACPRSHSLNEIRETLRAVGVSEIAIGQIHTMSLYIRPLGDPMLLTKGISGRFPNKSTRTTDRNQRGLLCKRVALCGLLSKQERFHSHIPPYPFISWITHMSDRIYTSSKNPILESSLCPLGISPVLVE